MLSVRNLSVSIGGASLLREISFDYYGGGMALMGPSGSGKTTLLKSLCGIHKKDTTGEIFWNNEPFHLLSIRERRIALCFQDALLLPHKNAFENASIGTTDLAFVEELFEVCEVAHLKKSYPATLSGGEAQRVSLIRGIASRPRMLLMDEVFSALDTILKYHVISRVKKILAREEIPFILVTHDILDINYCKQTVLLNNGQYILKPNGVSHESYL